MSKQDLPLSLLKLFPPELSINFGFEFGNGGNYTVRIFPKDEKLKFQFVILSVNGNNGNIKYMFSPQSETKLRGNEMEHSADQLETYFKRWLLLVESYRTTPTFFDDPIITKFEKDFKAHFAEEKNDYEPYESYVIELLYNHLEEIENKIEDFQTETTKDEIAEIKLLAQGLKNEVSRKSKGEIRKRLINIWARIQKASFSGFKHLVKKTFDVLIKEGITKAIDAADNVAGYLDKLN